MGYKKLLLGDEAVAQGALDAGISGGYAYPGTPSTEILEYIQEAPLARQRDIHRQWSSNEKTAYEEALGMAYAGKRALVCMKHVGVNVAADAFVNSAITGIRGGLVLAVADDPSMHSSQNEQDSRYYAKFARIPLLEPSNQPEAYRMTRYAFGLSEQLKLPVMIRLVTRLAHSRGDVHIQEESLENDLNPVSDKRRFNLLPLNARVNYQRLLSKQDVIRKTAEKSVYNKIEKTEDKSLGVICSGLGFNYLLENFEGHNCPYSIYRINHYPLLEDKLREFGSSCEKLLLLEEGDALIEEKVRDLFGPEKTIMGRLDGTLPRAGELNPDLVAEALEIKEKQVYENPENLPSRPPALCAGCPHSDTFEFLNETLENYPGNRVFSDIGCYTLGALEPYEAIDTCVDMGASITMAKGAADSGLETALAVLGDSTFTHSGMTGLLDAVYEDSAITVLILDNATTAMTGGQDSTGKGQLENICRGLGVSDEHLHVLKPIKPEHEKNCTVLKNELEFDGVSVLIVRRPCIQI